MTESAFRPEQAVEFHKQHGGTRSAAKALNVPRSTFRSWLRKARGGQPAEQASAPAPAAALAVSPRVVQLQDANRTLKKELESAIRHNIEAETIRQQVFGLTRAAWTVPDWTARVGVADDGPGIPCVSWADWHDGQTISAAEVHGINDYSPDVCEQRVRLLVEKTITLCKSYMVGADGKAPEYPGIVVFLCGDMVHGQLRDSDLGTNALEPLPQTIHCAKLISWALLQLADHFGRVCVATVEGNHGRTTRKPEAKRYQVKNLDWLVYQMVEHKLDGDKRFTFLASPTGEVLVPVGHTRYLLMHGDDLGVRGGDGIIGALGPIARGSLKTSAMQAHIGRDFDVLVIGHWHQPIPLRNVLVTNTLAGFDEFARRELKARPSTPSQWLWFEHPRWGRTALWEVFVDEPVRLRQADRQPSPEWLMAA